MVFNVLVHCSVAVSTRDTNNSRETNSTRDINSSRESSSTETLTVLERLANIAISPARNLVDFFI